MMSGDEPEAGAKRALTPAPPEPVEVGPGLGSGDIEQRLALILALDIRDYSVMISHDEAGAHDRVGKDLAVVVREIHRHNGHIHQFSGDGLLADSDARDTLRAALGVQLGASRRNSRRPVESRIEYRIGINAGDIVVQGGRIGGDTVNIAARLEQIAEPGGICISEAVFGQVNRSVKADYIKIGAVRLKNIRYPVSTYRVRAAGRAAAALSLSRGRSRGRLISTITRPRLRYSRSTTKVETLARIIFPKASLRTSSCRWRDCGNCGSYREPPCRVTAAATQTCAISAVRWACGMCCRHRTQDTTIHPCLGGP